MKIFLFCFLHTCSISMQDPQFIFNKQKEHKETNVQETPLFDPKSIYPIQLKHLSTSFLLNSPKPNKFAELPCYKEKMDEIRKLEKFEPLQKVGIAEAWLRAEMAVFFAENIFEYISNLESRISEQDRLILNRDLVNVKCASESIKLLMGTPIEELKTVDKELAQFFIYDVESETKTQ